MCLTYFVFSSLTFGFWEKKTAVRYLIQRDIIVCLMNCTTLFLSRKEDSLWEVNSFPLSHPSPSSLWDWTYVPLHPGCLLSGSTILSALIICLPTCSHFIIWRISNNFLWWHLEWYALLVSVDAKGPFSHSLCYCHILEDGGLTLLSWQTMCPELRRWHHLFLVYCERQATVACLPSHLLPASLLLFFLFLAMELSLGEEKDTINYFKSAKQERC